MARQKARMGRSDGTYGVKLVRGPFLKLPKHAFAVDDEEELDEILPRLRGPLAADLFCGAGGLSLGLSEAGFNIVLGVDHDEFALETHRAHHPGLSVNWDLGDREVVERIASLIVKCGISLVAGGPPCQPFSSAGRSALRDLVRKGVRDAYDLRSELWQSFLLAVTLARPPAVLMENVPDMALDRGMWILRSMVDELEELGYSVEEGVVSTSDYGVPQQRQRLILVALKDGVNFRWPDPTVEVNLRNAIGDLPEVEGGWRPTNGDDPADPVASGWAPYTGKPVTEFQKRMRRGVPRAQTHRVYDQITRPVREDDALAFAQMDSDTKYSDLEEGLRRYRADIFDDKYKRLDWNGLGRTITAHIAKDGYGFIHPDQDRTITVREAARIQTFPDHIRFVGPPSAAFKQIGNAVPPRLGEYLGRAVLDSLDAGEVSGPSTHELSSRLAGWFEERRVLSIPWLRAENRWQVIQAESLWSRLARDQTREAWETTRGLLTPDATLESAQTLQRYARLRGRGDRLEKVVQLAKWFVKHPDTLAVDATVEDLRSAPNLGPSVADLSVRICPGDAVDRDEPVLVTSGLLRVVSRVLGKNLERQNKYSDGRLAVARLIGGEVRSHMAHLALFELANSVCVNGPSPDCGNCPLLGSCHFANENAFQIALPITTPGA